ncbi:hypothetical protein FFE93_006805 [Yersinia sp. KBS0713]|nr:hypothetical protein FFE93_006805 [Yersinia sp. KBS0713]
MAYSHQPESSRYSPAAHCPTDEKQGLSIYPKNAEPQVGSQQTHPDELTSVSDSGKCAQLTPLWFQEHRNPQSHWSHR